MHEQEQRPTPLESPRPAIAPAVSTDDNTYWQAGSLTPIVIVVYLALFTLWTELGPMPLARYAIPYDCAFLFVVALVLACRGRRQEIRHYFLGRLIPGRRDVPQAILVLFLLFGWGLMTVMLRWQGTGSQAYYYTPIAVVGSLILGPVTEEIVRHGIILSVLLKYNAPARVTTLLISAAIITGLHPVRDDHYAAMILFGLSILIGYAYMATRSVPFCILCHAMWNGVPYLLSRT